MAGELAGMTAACLTRPAEDTRQNTHAATTPEGSASAAEQAKPGSIVPSTEAHHEYAATQQATVARAFAAPPPCIAAHAYVEVEDGSPFELSTMLRDLLVTYTQHLPNVQTAAHLILAMTPCLPTPHPLPRSATAAAVEIYASAYLRAGFESDNIPVLLEQSLSHIINAGLQPLQLEAILSTYHEQLIAHRCFVEAAALRSLCYPTFPAVYEHSLRDNEVALMCGECGSPKDTTRFLQSVPFVSVAKVYSVKMGQDRACGRNACGAIMADTLLVCGYYSKTKGILAVRELGVCAIAVDLRRVPD
ncbi:SEA (Seh1-associated) complex subunit [Oleoguttula sp. CCFEE 5521]